MEDTSNKSTGTVRTKEEEEQHERRRSVAKEHWRDFLEAVVTVEAEKELINNMQQAAASDNDSSFISTDTHHHHHNGSPQRTSMSMISVATSAMTGVEREELNDDLEQTANLLGELELEFAEDIQMLNMGLNTAFDQWGGASQHTGVSDNPVGMMMMIDDMSAMGGEPDMLGTSIRSAATTHYDELGGPSVRSIRSHVRHLDHVKKDMENTFRETIFKGSLHAASAHAHGSPSNAQDIALARRRSSAGDTTVGGGGGGAVPVEEDLLGKPGENNYNSNSTPAANEKEENNLQLAKIEPDPLVEMKFQNWFARVWSAVEGLLARQRAQRLLLEKQQQQIRVEQHLEQLEHPPPEQEQPTETEKQEKEEKGRRRSSAAKIKSFWRLFMEPPPPPRLPPSASNDDDEDHTNDSAANELQQQNSRHKEGEDDEQPVYDEETL